MWQQRLLLGAAHDVIKASSTRMRMGQQGMRPSVLVGPRQGPAGMTSSMGNSRGSRRRRWHSRMLLQRPSGGDLGAAQQHACPAQQPRRQGQQTQQKTPRHQQAHPQRPWKRQQHPPQQRPQLRPRPQPPTTTAAAEGERLLRNALHAARCRWVEHAYSRACNGCRACNIQPMAYCA